jgi:hypothetical protein
MSLNKEFSLLSFHFLPHPLLITPGLFPGRSGLSLTVQKAALAA